MAGITTHAIQTLSVSVSLLAAGGIAGLSLFDVPELQSQPADRALPQIRWLFSRGSHIFPQASVCIIPALELPNLTRYSDPILPRLCLPSLRCPPFQPSHS